MPPTTLQDREAALDLRRRAQEWARLTHGVELDQLPGEVQTQLIQGVGQLAQPQPTMEMPTTPMLPQPEPFTPPAYNQGMNVIPVDQPAVDSPQPMRSSVPAISAPMVPPRGVPRPEDILPADSGVNRDFLGEAPTWAKAIAIIGALQGKTGLFEHLRSGAMSQQGHADAAHALARADQLVRLNESDDAMKLLSNAIAQSPLAGTSPAIKVMSDLVNRSRLEGILPYLQGRVRDLVAQGIPFKEAIEGLVVQQTPEGDLHIIDKIGGTSQVVRKGMGKVVAPGSGVVRSNEQGGYDVQVPVPKEPKDLNLGSDFNLYAISNKVDPRAADKDTLAVLAEKFRAEKTAEKGPALTGEIGLMAHRIAGTTEIGKMPPEVAARVERAWNTQEEARIKFRARVQTDEQFFRMTNLPLGLVDKGSKVIDTKNWRIDSMASFNDVQKKVGDLSIVREEDIGKINRISSTLRILDDIEKVSREVLAERPGDNFSQAVRNAIDRRLGKAKVAEFDALRGNILGVGGLIQGDNRVSNLDQQTIGGFEVKDTDTVSAGVARLNALRRSLTRMRAALANAADPVESSEGYLKAIENAVRGGGR